MTTVSRISTSDGVYQSEVFPGLWLEADAVTEGNLSRVLEVLQKGIDSDAPRQFIDRHTTSTP